MANANPKVKAQLEKAHIELLQRVPKRVNLIAPEDAPRPLIVKPPRLRGAPLPPPPTEAEIQKVVLAYLERHKRVALVWRSNTGAVQIENRFVRFGKPGVPDILGCLKDGRFLAIEVKRGKNIATKTQAEFLEKVRRAGGVAGVVRCLQDVVKLLGEANVKPA